MPTTEKAGQAAPAVFMPWANLGQVSVKAAGKEEVSVQEFQ